MKFRVAKREAAAPPASGSSSSSRGKAADPTPERPLVKLRVKAPLRAQRGPGSPSSGPAAQREVVGGEPPAKRPCWRAGETAAEDCAPAATRHVSTRHSAAGDRQEAAARALSRLRGLRGQQEKRGAAAAAPAPPLQRGPAAAAPPEHLALPGGAAGCEPAILLGQAGVGKTLGEKEPAADSKAAAGREQEQAQQQQKQQQQAQQKQEQERQQEQRQPSPPRRKRLLVRKGSWKQNGQPLSSSEKARGAAAQGKEKGVPSEPVSSARGWAVRSPAAEGAGGEAGAASVAVKEGLSLEPHPARAAAESAAQRSAQETGQGRACGAAGKRKRGREEGQSGNCTLAQSPSITPTTPPGPCLTLRTQQPLEAASKSTAQSLPLVRASAGAITEDTRRPTGSGAGGVADRSEPAQQPAQGASAKPVGEPAAQGSKHNTAGAAAGESMALQTSLPPPALCTAQPGGSGPLGAEPLGEIREPAGALSPAAASEQPSLPGGPVTPPLGGAPARQVQAGPAAQAQAAQRQQEQAGHEKADGAGTAAQALEVSSEPQLAVTTVPTASSHEAPKPAAAERKPDPPPLAVPAEREAAAAAGQAPCPQQSLSELGVDLAALHRKLAGAAGEARGAAWQAAQRQALRETLAHLTAALAQPFSPAPSEARTTAGVSYVLPSASRQAGVEGRFAPLPPLVLRPPAPAPQGGPAVDAMVDTILTQDVAALRLPVRDDAAVKAYLLHPTQRTALAAQHGGTYTASRGTACFKDSLTDRAFVCLHYRLTEEGALEPCGLAGPTGCPQGREPGPGGRRTWGVDDSNVQVAVLVRKGVGGTCPARLAARKLQRQGLLPALLDACPPGPTLLPPAAPIPSATGFKTPAQPVQSTAAAPLAALAAAVVAAPRSTAEHCQASTPAPLGPATEQPAAPGGVPTSRAAQKPPAPQGPGVGAAVVGPTPPAGTLKEDPRGMGQPGQPAEQGASRNSSAGEEESEQLAPAPASCPGRPLSEGTAGPSPTAGPLSSTAVLSGPALQPTSKVSAAAGTASAASTAPAAPATPALLQPRPLQAAPSAPRPAMDSAATAAAPLVQPQPQPQPTLPRPLAQPQLQPRLQLHALPQPKAQPAPEAQPQRQSQQQVQPQPPAAQLQPLIRPRHSAAPLGSLTLPAWLQATQQQRGISVPGLSTHWTPPPVLGQQGAVAQLAAALQATVQPQAAAPAAQPVARQLPSPPPGAHSELTTLGPLVGSLAGPLPAAASTASAAPPAAPTSKGGEPLGGVQPQQPAAVKLQPDTAAVKLVPCSAVEPPTAPAVGVLPAGSAPAFCSTAHEQRPRLRASLCQLPGPAAGPSPAQGTSTGLSLPLLSSSPPLQPPPQPTLQGMQHAASVAAWLQLQARAGQQAPTGAAAGASAAPAATQLLLQQLLSSCLRPPLPLGQVTSQRPPVLRPAVPQPAPPSLGPAAQPRATPLPVGSVAQPQPAPLPLGPAAQAQAAQPQAPAAPLVRPSLMNWAALRPFLVQLYLSQGQRTGGTCAKRPLAPPAHPFRPPAFGSAHLAPMRPRGPPLRVVPQGSPQGRPWLSARAAVPQGLPVKKAAVPQGLPVKKAVAPSGLQPRPKRPKLGSSPLPPGGRKPQGERRPRRGEGSSPRGSPEGGQQQLEQEEGLDDLLQELDASEALRQVAAGSPRGGANPQGDALGVLRSGVLTGHPRLRLYTRSCRLELYVGHATWRALPTERQAQLKGVAVELERRLSAQLQRWNHAATAAFASSLAASLGPPRSIPEGKGVAGAVKRLTESTIVSFGSSGGKSKLGPCQPRSPPSVRVTLAVGPADRVQVRLEALPDKAAGSSLGQPSPSMGGEAAAPGKIPPPAACDAATAAVLTAAAALAASSLGTPSRALQIPWPAYLIGTRDCFTYDLVPLKTEVEVNGRRFTKTEYFFPPGPVPDNYLRTVGQAAVPLALPLPPSGEVRPTVPGPASAKRGPKETLREQAEEGSYIRWADRWRDRGRLQSSCSQAPAPQAAVARADGNDPAAASGPLPAIKQEEAACSEGPASLPEAETGAMPSGAPSQPEEKTRVQPASSAPPATQSRHPQGLLPVGITTYTEVFSEAELQAIERGCDASDEAARAGALPPAAFHVTKARGGGCKRTKFFYGARYMWTPEQLAVPLARVARGVRIDVPPPPPWMKAQIERPLVDAQLVPPGFINQFALNIYHDGSEGIQSHYDDAGRFDRPITSLRTFSDSRLSFGTQLYGYTNGAFTVDMPRGCVTVMEAGGYAAEGVKHCVRPADLAGKSAGLIMRRINPACMAAARALHEEEALEALRGLSLSREGPDAGSPASLLLLRSGHPGLPARTRPDPEAAEVAGVLADLVDAVELSLTGRVTRLQPPPRRGPGRPPGSAAAGAASGRGPGRPPGAAATAAPIPLRGLARDTPEAAEVAGVLDSLVREVERAEAGPAAARVKRKFGLLGGSACATAHTQRPKLLKSTGLLSGAQPACKAAGTCGATPPGGRRVPQARLFHRQQGALLALAARLLPASPASGASVGAGSTEAGQQAAGLEALTGASPQRLQARLQEVLQKLQAAGEAPTPAPAISEALEDGEIPPGGSSSPGPGLSPAERRELEAEGQALVVRLQGLGPPRGQGPPRGPAAAPPTVPWSPGRDPHAPPAELLRGAAAGPARTAGSRQSTPGITALSRAPSVICSACELAVCEGLAGPQKASTGGRTPLAWLCRGPCRRAYHAACGAPAEGGALPLCGDCRAGRRTCCVCGEGGLRGGCGPQKCGMRQCGRAFHPDCARACPLTSWGAGSRSFRCPVHYCACCGLSGDSVPMVQCARCPVAYHWRCRPHEAVVLSKKFIVCPRH